MVINLEIAEGVANEWLLPNLFFAEHIQQRVLLDQHFISFLLLIFQFQILPE